MRFYCITKINKMKALYFKELVGLNKIFCGTWMTQMCDCLMSLLANFFTLGYCIFKIKCSKQILKMSEFGIFIVNLIFSALWKFKIKSNWLRWVDVFKWNKSRRGRDRECLRVPVCGWWRKKKTVRTEV